MKTVVINGESPRFYNAIEGVLSSDRFGCVIEIIGKRVGEEYLVRCAKAFNRIPEETLEKLYNASAEYLTDLVADHTGEFDLDEYCVINAENVRYMLRPEQLTAEAHDLLADEDAPAAYSVTLVFRPVPDERIEWTVRDGEPVYVGEFRGISPWNEKVRKKSWNYVREC